MSEARTAAMGKIQAIIDGHTFTIENPDLITEDLLLDQAASVQSNQDLLEEQRILQAKLKTEADIQRLEEAKRKASSQTVKDELDAEAKLIRNERLKAEEEEKERQENTAATDLIRDRVSDIGSGVQKQIGATVNRVTDVSKEAWTGLSNVATPGSIFLPVSVLIIFFLLLLPVNGHTRIEWLWLALTGNAHLQGETPGGSATGGSADFGGPAGGSADLNNLVYTPAVPSFTGPSEVF